MAHIKEHDHENSAMTPDPISPTVPQVHEAVSESHHTIVSTQVKSNTGKENHTHTHTYKCDG